MCKLNVFQHRISTTKLVDFRVRWKNQIPVASFSSQPGFVNSMYSPSQEKNWHIPAWDDRVCILNHKNWTCLAHNVWSKNLMTAKKHNFSTIIDELKKINDFFKKKKISSAHFPDSLHSFHECGGSDCPILFLLKLKIRNFFIIEVFCGTFRVYFEIFSAGQAWNCKII